MGTCVVNVFTRMQDDVFSPKFGAQICEFVLNSRVKCRTAPQQTKLLWTGPCGARPWPALLNHYVRSPLFWGIMQPWVVIPYWRFRTT